MSLKYLWIPLPTYGNLFLQIKDFESNFILRNKNNLGIKFCSEASFLHSPVKIFSLSSPDAFIIPTVIVQ